MFVLVTLCACSGNDDVPAPQVTSMLPAHAPPGVTVMLLGDHFCQQPDTGSDDDPLACEHDGSVVFGEAPGTVGQYQDQTITVEVPTLPPGPIDVTVTVAGRRSNHADFRIDPP
jgi:hypothetical protein